ncbi:MAG: MFS transporter [Anaerolineales bacterium]|nr:MFS transporter [Anaerolineales bacterium]
METSQKHEKRWLILGVMCIVLFIISIDNTVLNLALPSIASGFGATASQLQWIVDAYTLVFASLLITTGSIGDRYGRKRSLIIGLALFGLGSLGAALSLSTTMLIGFRALLGLAGALIMPSTLSILIDVFRNGRERAKAIALWSSIFAIGAGIGPLIGGILINYFNWSSVFYLNLPIVVIGIVGGITLVPESSDSATPRPDFPGVFLSVTGLISLVYGMIRAGEDGWTSVPVLLTFGIAAVFLAAFIWWENHSKNPMLPLVFFKNMAFTGANAALTISAFAMMGSIYFFSQFFQSVQGYSPIMAAVCMVPMNITVFIATMISVRVDRKMGTKFTMSLGLLFSGLGLFLFSHFAAINTSYWFILIAIICLGIGIGFTMSPATTSIMNSLPPNRAGIGSAMNDTTRQLGGALGIAVLGSVMNGIYRTELTALNGVSGLSGSIMDQIRGSVQSAHLFARELGGNLEAVIVQASSQAFVDGMQQALFIASIVMILAAITAWSILPGKEESLQLRHGEAAQD